MAMPALQFDDDQPVLDPDSLKMPETPAHRRAVDLIGLAASRLLGVDSRVFRDMNWYPTDGGGPMAPDLMVLPAVAIGPDLRSYRQNPDGGPPPMVVFEMPSESDSFASFRAKALRYQALGTVVYLVVTERPHPAVLRLGRGDREPQPWADLAISELAGLRLGFDGDELVATLPDGTRARSDADLVAMAHERAAEAETRAAEAHERAAEAEARAAAAERAARALTRRLEALGIDSDLDSDLDQRPEAT